MMQIMIKAVILSRIGVRGGVDEFSRGTVVTRIVILVLVVGTAGGFVLAVVGDAVGSVITVTTGDRLNQFNGIVIIVVLVVEDVVVVVVLVVVLGNVVFLVVVDVVDIVVRTLATDDVVKGVVEVVVVVIVVAVDVVAVVVVVFAVVVVFVVVVVVVAVVVAVVVVVADVVVVDVVFVIAFCEDDGLSRSQVEPQPTVWKDSERLQPSSSGVMGVLCVDTIIEDDELIQSGSSSQSNLSLPSSVA